MAYQHNDPNENRWVEERLEALGEPEGFRPDVAKARARLRGRQEMASHWTRRAWAAAAIVVAALLTLALPGPRAAAQRLWDRMTLGRVQVIQNRHTDLPGSITAAFEWRDLSRQEPVRVRDVAEAERLAGFRPMLPAPGVVNASLETRLTRQHSFDVPFADVEQHSRRRSCLPLTGLGTTIPRCSIPVPDAPG